MFFQDKRREYKNIYWFCVLLLVIVIFNFKNRELHAFSTSRAVSEYEVKAAFLFNFSKFIAWPSEKFPAPDEPFIIGILGEDPFGPVLDQTINGKTIKGRNIIIRRFAGLKELESCHIIFICLSEREHLKEIFEITEEWNSLTVGDMNQFAEAGGIIGFTLKKMKVRFSINIDAARRSGLKISSKLLKIARIVKDAVSGEKMVNPKS